MASRQAWFHVVTIGPCGQFKEWIVKADKMMSRRWPSISASPSKDSEPVGIFPWLQFGQTANSATTAASAPLVAFSYSNNFHWSFCCVDLMVFHFGGEHKQWFHINFSSETEKEKSWLIWAFYTAGWRMLFMHNCPPTLHSRPHDVSEIKVTCFPPQVKKISQKSFISFKMDIVWRQNQHQH